MSSLDARYFDDMYAVSQDPWGFESRWYEARKYAVSAALLPAPRYERAFEPGCSIGVFTRMLAPRCDRLLAWELSAVAARTAATRTAGLPSVQVENRVIGADWPDGAFDLIVFSEILYYFGGSDLDRVLDLASASLRPSGTLLVVHWRHQVAEYPRGGDEVHEIVRARPQFGSLVRHVEPDFLADVLVKGEAVSVADAEGLL